jgi:Protein of unknown function (DUF2505)
MEFSTTQDFPATVAQLWAVFGQPGYPQRKYLALGSSTVRLHRFDAGARSIEVDLERDLPRGGASAPILPSFPAWARRALGRAARLRHRSSWRRTGAAGIAAVLDIELVGLPVRAHGEGSIVELAPARSRMTLHWHVRANLPWLRDEVERLFADGLQAALEDDHRFTLAWLRAEGLARPGGAA